MDVCTIFTPYFKRIFYTYLIETIVSFILAYDTFEMPWYILNFFIYIQKPIIKYSSSLLVYIEELIAFTCGI